MVVRIARCFPEDVLPLPPTASDGDGCAEAAAVALSTANIKANELLLQF